MSRIGLKEIIVPLGVKFSLKKSILCVEGVKGVLYQKIVDKRINFNFLKDKIKISIQDGSSKYLKALHGLYRSLLNNMIIGVNVGYFKKLEIVGVGYRAKLEGQNLNLFVGYSHVVQYSIPVNVGCNLEKNDLIIVLHSCDKQLLGQVAADIRSIRPPEPYKKKGIRYFGEIIRSKAGKARKSK